MVRQWRTVSHEPDVAEGIDESALAMDSPWRLMIANLIQRAVRTFPYRARDEGIGIVAKHLDPR